MSALYDHHVCPEARAAMYAAHADTAPDDRVRLERLVSIANVLLEWRYRPDEDGAGLYCDLAVSQIAAHTAIPEGMVRRALTILARAGVVVAVAGHRGGGSARRGTIRRLYLSAGEWAARAAANSARCTARSSEDPTPRGNTPTPRGRALTPRGQPRDSDIPDIPVEERAPATTTTPGPEWSRWADDADVETDPPPLADTIAAIRALTHRAGSSLMTSMLTHQPVHVPDAPPPPPPPIRARYGGPLDR